MAHYFDLPVNLVRALAVVALFLGFFAITIVIYLLMWFFIEPAPAGYQDETDISVKVTKLMNEIDQQLKAGEKNCAKWNAISLLIVSVLIVASINCN
ncbi:MAG: PspC domain-containing protein [Candidatus Arsenophonus phytopathogenicus]